MTAVSEGSKSEAKLVRRNLFMGEQMKSPMKNRNSLNSKREAKTPKKNSVPLLQKTPKAHHVLKTKNVSETPHHKQIQKGMWCRLEKERKRSQTVSDIEVVEESPNKAPSKEFRSANAVKKVNRATIGLARRTSFYSAGPEMESRSVKRYEQLEARITSQNPLTSPNAKTTTAKVSPPRRIRPMKLFANLNSPSPQKVHGRILPSSAKAVRRLEIFDSPSKHTRSRSLFAPPEIDPSSVMSTDRITFQSISNSINPQHSINLKNISSKPRNSVTSPQRRIVPQEVLMSPQKNIQFNPFSSPVKPSQPLIFETPTKQKNTPFGNTYTSPEGVSSKLTCLTPRRSQRLLTSPSSQSIKDGAMLSKSPQKQGFTSPLKESIQNRNEESVFKESPSKAYLTSPLKRVIQNNIFSPIKTTPRKKQSQTITPKKNVVQSERTIGYLRNTPSKARNVLGDQMVLRKTPQRLRTSPSNEGTLYDRVDKDISIKNSLLSSNADSDKNKNHAINSTIDPNLNSSVDILSPRKSQRLVNQLNFSSPKKTQSPAINFQKSPPSTESTKSVPGTPKGRDKRDDDSGFTPPLDKPNRNVSSSATPSRKFKGGRITPEPQSPMDSWPRKKKRTYTIRSPSICRKLEGSVVGKGGLMGDEEINPIPSLSCEATKFDDSLGLKRKLSPSSLETNSTNDLQEATIIRKRRKVSCGSRFAQHDNDKTSTIFKDIFESSSSKNTLSFPAFEDDLGLPNNSDNVNNDKQDILDFADEHCLDEDINAKTSSPFLNKGMGSPKQNITTPRSVRNLSSPGTKRFSPVSALSLAHLVQSPILEKEDSTNLDRSTRPFTSRRSLYKF